MLKSNIFNDKTVEEMNKNENNKIKEDKKMKDKENLKNYMVQRLQLKKKEQKIILKLMTEK